MRKINPDSSVNMSDIAQAAGVSLATVGRVLHQNGYVSPATREKIERLVLELGYVPNKMAQGLKNSRSRLLGHLLVFNTNMLFAKISLAVNTAALENGFHVLTMTSHKNKNEEQDQVRELIGHRVDGVIITSNIFIARPLIQKLVNLKIPVVMIERTLDLPHVDCINIDDLGGSLQAVRHLISKGHTRVGFIGAGLPHAVENLRLQGYREALQGAGLPLAEELQCFTSDYSVEAGRQAAETLLSLENPPTALFATSDLFICGVLQHLQRLGKRVPEDLSLVGYDDTLSTLLAPPVTSVGLSLDEIGRQAVQLLLQRMEDPRAPARTITVPTVLMERGSVTSPA